MKPHHQKTGLLSQLAILGVALLLGACDLYLVNPQTQMQNAVQPTAQQDAQAELAAPAEPPTPPTPLPGSSEIVFMDSTTYDQMTLDPQVVGEASNFLLENQTATVAIHDGNPLYVELPASVVLEITYTEPGLQGDRATGGSKPATLETGFQIQVPLFIENNTRVKVDTRTGEYLGRASE